MYLMEPDNKFVAFYTLNPSEDELRNYLIENISYDKGQRFLGTGNRPVD